MAMLLIVDSHGILIFIDSRVHGPKQSSYSLLPPGRPLPGSAVFSVAQWSAHINEGQACQFVVFLQFSTHESPAMIENKIFFFLTSMNYKKEDFSYPLLIQLILVIFSDLFRPRNYLPFFWILGCREGSASIRAKKILCAVCAVSFFPVSILNPATEEESPNNPQVV